MKRNRSGIGIKSKGFGTIGWLLIIPIAIVVVLILAFAFFEGRKAYWDNVIRAMCEKEGGIKVYERVLISSRYLDKDRNIKIPSAYAESSRKPFEWEAKPGDLYYYVSERQPIIDGYLAVGRTNLKIIRALDKKVLGETVVFRRSGGDFPTFAHPSSFVCPKDQSLPQLQEAVFVKPRATDQ
jgi:hypothetical protein